MNIVFKKLNFKGQEEIYIINAPPTFSHAMDEMKVLTKIKTKLSAGAEVKFFLAFVTKQKEVDELVNKVASLMDEDGILWFAYPKGTSKNYKCEFNRDTGWAVLGKHGFEGVRLVAIDEDWSALRFRKAENIKVMKRSFAMSESGKKKVKDSKKIVDKSASK